MKAGASWRGGGGGGGVAAKNTFKIGGGPSVVLSSGRSTPQTLNSSFISAFITVRVLSSSSTFSRLWGFFFLFPPQRRIQTSKHLVQGLKKGFRCCSFRSMFSRAGIYSMFLVLLGYNDEQTTTGGAFL